MKEKESGGIKSALELALERLDREGEQRPSLTKSQKEALQKIEKELAAKVAETEILARKGLQEARVSGDAERLQELEEHLTREVSRLRREAERKKAKIREEGARRRETQK